MIVGVITADREAVISFSVRGADEQEQSIEAALDTGFNGYLTLVPAWNPRRQEKRDADCGESGRE